MECTKLNCPLQAGTKTENCGENCPWRTTVKTFDLISRAEAIEAIKPLLYSGNCVSTLINMPAVDAVPVKHARWILVQNGSGVCSACNRSDHIDPLAAYCRYCGAKMDIAQTTANTDNPLSTVKISKPTYRLEYPC